MEAHKGHRSDSDITAISGRSLEDLRGDVAAHGHIELLPLPTTQTSTDTIHKTSQQSVRDTIQENSQPSKHRYRIFWFWKWEFAALTLAFGLVAAMFALLLSFNGQRVPDWGYSINLSTLLDLLAQIFCAAMGIVVAQIIAQERWTWFSLPENTGRPLQDLQDFDQGSRDSLGAALLIPKVIFRNNTVALAALVMITSLAVGPFVQQAVQTTSCSYIVPDGTASVPYAHYVPRKSMILRVDGDITIQEGTPDLELESAVYSSLTGGSTASENQITPVCSTGNCTFKVGDPIESSFVTVNGTTVSGASGSSGSFSTVAVCSSCVDATSLVRFIKKVDVEEDYTSTVYGLPNGLRIDYGGFGTYLNVSTDRNLDWLGDLLTPGHAQAARWAMVNVTLLSFSVAQCGETVTAQCPIPGKTNLAGGDSSAPNKTAGGIAATCALFPCIRRYVPSITNNKFLESQIDSSQVWPAIDYYYASLHLETENALTNSESNYAGIQTPCRVDDSIYTAENISTAPNATRLWVHETMIDGTVQSKNISAPEPCIYRHSALFVSALSSLLQQKDTIFNTYCQYDPEEGPDCNLQGGDGMNTWVDTVYNNGDATVSAVEAYFESFAVAMTNKYRSTFGSSQYVRQPRPHQLLPPGEVQGIVWQDTVCTAARWQWLFLPVGLLLLTTSLLAVTVVRGWKLRRVQPVWKANILTTLLYKERFVVSNSPVSSRPLGTTGANITKQCSTDTDESLNRLLDTDEIKKMTKSIMVRFEWNDLEHESTQYMESQQGWLKRRQMSTSGLDVDSLLMEDGESPGQ